MPLTRHRPTEKQRLIQRCLEAFDMAIDEHHLLQQLIGPTHPTIPLLWYEFLMQLYSARYLRPRRRLPFSTDLRNRVLSLYPKDKFKTIIRLEPEELNRLARILSGNNAFRHDDQEPALEQIIIELKVTLFRLGVEGVPVEHVAFIFGVSVGSVHNYTWRCIHALAALAPQYVTWPNERQKLDIKRHFFGGEGVSKLCRCCGWHPFPIFHRSFLGNPNLEHPQVQLCHGWYRCL